MGIVSALFIILLSTSGFVIHHSAFFNLDQRYTDSPTLLSWYGIEAPDVSIAFTAQQHSVALLADAIYFDTQRLQGSFSSLIGLVAVDFGYVVALTDRLLLLTTSGELIEVLGSVNNVPQNIQAIGSDNGDVYLKLEEAENRIVKADLNSMSWAYTSTESIQWSEALELSQQQSQKNQAHYASTLLNWDRVMLDIHSGRFLGNWGVILVDIMAFLFVLMGVTGVWIWSRRRP